ncbi:DUF2255 family protein [uncultured Bartonella sp.]|uniref:DUF2255 family protein n=1 Tax=uncultured Bartonella sp. TaxID=104108 RepID=UPI0025F0CEB9|nr:DUF2255 family protein [uncultured Bartonella sp.]
MTDWTIQELEAIDKADDLKIAPFHEDLTTTGTPTWIWEVVVDDGLYVRAYSGTASRWYQAAIRQKGGKIIAAGKTISVNFEAVKEPALLDRIDAAYHKKYDPSPYVGPMITARAKAATIRIKKV